MLDDFYVDSLLRTEEFYEVGTNLGRSRFKSLEKIIYHAKTTISKNKLNANEIYFHPSNMRKILSFSSVKKEDYKIVGLKLFGMFVYFSMFVCNDESILVDSTVPISSRSVVIIKI